MRKFQQFVRKRLNIKNLQQNNNHVPKDTCICQNSSCQCYFCIVFYRCHIHFGQHGKDILLIEENNT